MNKKELPKLIESKNLIDAFFKLELDLPNSKKGLTDIVDEINHKLGTNYTYGVLENWEYNHSKKRLNYAVRCHMMEVVLFYILKTLATAKIDINKLPKSYINKMAKLLVTAC